MNALALIFEEGILRLGKMADIEEATRTQREYLSVAYENDPHISAWKLHLGLELERRYQATKSIPDLTEAISLCISALHQDNAYPRTRIKAGRHAVRLCGFLCKWQEAFRAASAAMSLIPTMIIQSLDNSDKQRLIAENFDLASDAAAVALNVGESPYVCLHLLEQGRGILAESLQSIRTDSLRLRGEHPDMEEKYVRLCQELDLPDFAEPEARTFSWEARASPLQCKQRTRGSACRNPQTIWIRGLSASSNGEGNAERCKSGPYRTHQCQQTPLRCFFRRRAPDKVFTPG